MKITIRPYIEKDLEAIIDLSLLAWEPVFGSFQNIFPRAIYDILYPDWQKSQAEGVKSVCENHETYTTLVSEVGGKAVGFISYELKPEEKQGVVNLLAVHPDYQNQDIGTQLNLAALEAIQEAGMTLAIVETGGDESHAPARRSYEKAGYSPFPIVRYFKEVKGKD